MNNKFIQDIFFFFFLKFHFEKKKFPFLIPRCITSAFRPGIRINFFISVWEPGFWLVERRSVLLFRISPQILGHADLVSRDAALEFVLRCRCPATKGFSKHADTDQFRGYAGETELHVLRIQILIWQLTISKRRNFPLKWPLDHL